MNDADRVRGVVREAARLSLDACYYDDRLQARVIYVHGSERPGCVENVATAIAARVVERLAAPAAPTPEPTYGVKRRTRAQLVALVGENGADNYISFETPNDPEATIPADEIEALASAAWDGGRGNDPLLRLLRRLHPGDPVVGHIDARARANGFVQAGSDERLPDDTTLAGDR